MTARKPLNTALLTLIGVSAIGLLISLTLCLTMPDNWEYRGAAEGVRKICFLGVIAGGAVRAMNEYKAKKRAEAAVETAQPARLRKVKAK